MRDIDGSYGEGGGQLLRTACALSAITGEPGPAAQHPWSSIGPDTIGSDGIRCHGSGKTSVGSDTAWRVGAVRRGWMRKATAE